MVYQFYIEDKREEKIRSMFILEKNHTDAVLEYLNYRSYTDVNESTDMIIPNEIPITASSKDHTISVLKLNVGANTVPEMFSAFRPTYFKVTS